MDPAARTPRLSRREWRIVAGAVLLDLAVSSLFAWDVFTPVLSDDLGVATPSLAIVFSVGLVGFTIGVLGGGRTADAVSPRLLTLGAAAGAVAGLLGAAAAQSVAALVVTFGVLLGVSTGTGYATAVRVAGTITTRRGLALGLVVSAYAAGTIILAPIAAALLSALGRAGTFAVLAAATAVILLAAAMLLPGSAPPASTRTPRRRRGPLDSRATPYSAATLRLWIVFGLGSAPALAAFAHAGELGGLTHASALAVALLSAGNLTGRLVAGPASDRIGRTAALHLASAALLGASLVLGFVELDAVRLIALLLLGAQYGALSALIPAVTADTVPQARLGATFGVVFSGWGVAGLLAPLVAAQAAGYLAWDHAFTLFIAPAALSWIAVAIPGIVRRTR